MQLWSEAVLVALRNRDAAMLELLLSSQSPWDAESLGKVTSVVNMARQGTAKWSQWRDTLEIAFKYYLVQPKEASRILRMAWGRGDAAFVAMAKGYGFSME